jgi:hypothetical protein
MKMWEPETLATLRASVACTGIALPLSFPEDGGICSTETSVDAHRTSSRHTTEDRTFHSLISDKIVDFMAPKY